MNVREERNSNQVKESNNREPYALVNQRKTIMFSALQTTVTER